MHLLMLTSSCDPNLKEEGFISDWILAISEKVDFLTLITISKPTIKLPDNVFSYSLVNQSKIGKIWKIGYIFLKTHRQIPIDGVFCNMYDFLGVLSGLFSRILNIKSVFWYAGGIKVPFLSLTTVAFWLNNKITTCSQQEKLAYHAMFKTPSSKIHVIGHGINRKRFSVNKTIKKDKEFRIGYCCRLSLSKNIETFIGAVVKCINLSEPIELLIALSKTKHKPDYFNKLKSRTREKNGNIKIKILTDVNYANNIQFYQKLDLYVHPSFQTSIDKAAVEAAFSNVSVLLSENGFGELFDFNADIVFNPHDSQKLGELISKYTKYPKLREVNKQIILSKFNNMDLPFFVEKLIAVY